MAAESFPDPAETSVMTKMDRRRFLGASAGAAAALASFRNSHAAESVASTAAAGDVPPPPVVEASPCKVRLWSADAVKAAEFE